MSLTRPQARCYVKEDWVISHALHVCPLTMWSTASAALSSHLGEGEREGEVGVRVRGEG